MLRSGATTSWQIACWRWRLGDRPAGEEEAKKVHAVTEGSPMNTRKPWHVESNSSPPSSNGKTLTKGPASYVRPRTCPRGEQTRHISPWTFVIRLPVSTPRVLRQAVPWKDCYSVVQKSHQFAPVALMISAWLHGTMRRHVGGARRRAPSCGRHWLRGGLPALANNVGRKRRMF